MIHRAESPPPLWRDLGPPSHPIHARPAPVKPVDPNLHHDDVARVKGQNERVLARLREGWLGPGEAFAVMGISRLAARIRDCREAGYAIVDRRNDETKCQEYRLAVKP